MPYNIFPIPRKYRTGEQYLDLRDAQWVVVDAPFSGTFITHVLDFLKDLRALFKNRIIVSRGYPAPGLTPEQGQGSGQYLLVIRQLTTPVKTGYYKLGVEHNYLLLEAGSEAAAFYGLQSLHQLLSQAGTRFQGWEIEDYPEFPVRGVMLDISRCKVPGLETLCHLIKLFSKLKINQLHLYMEHTFAFAAHHTVWSDASPLTAEDILILDNYCKEHYIDLVPNFNSFGHFERWLKHPEYKYLAESPDGFRRESGEWVAAGSTLMPDSTSLAFLETLYKELLPNFSSPFFHAGLDETWELGKGRSRERCEKEGTIRVYTDFVKEIHKRVTQHNRQMMFWADIIIKEPALVKILPRDIIACIWGYEENHPFTAQIAPFKDSGFPYYVCPGTASWNSLTGRTDTCLANLRNAAEAGPGAAGYLTTDWGDNGHHQYLPISYPGFTAGAGYSWNPSLIEDSALAAALDRIVFAGCAEGAGALLLELGRMHNGIPVKNPNETIINRLLFHTGTHPELISNLQPVHLQACLRQLESLEGQWAQIRVQDKETMCVKREYNNALLLARCSLNLGLRQLNQEVNKPQLKQALLQAIAEHESLWLERNRPGGLQESAAYLRRCLDL